MKIKDQRRITIRGIHYAAFASQETLCFSATLCFDGTPVCVVSNEGQGGCDDRRPLKGEGYEQMAQKLDPVKEFVNALEPEELEGGTPLPADLELVVGELMNAWLVERSFTTHVRTRWLYTLEGQRGLFFVSKSKVGNPDMWADLYERMHQKRPQFLHTLPRDTALAIYRERTA